MSAEKEAETQSGGVSSGRQAGRPAGWVIQPAALSAICHLIAGVTAEPPGKHTLLPLLHRMNFTAARFVCNLRQGARDDAEQ